MTKSVIRRLLEIAYKKAWGPNGTSDDRDEWHIMYKALKDRFNLGTMSRKDFTLTWED